MTARVDCSSVGRRPNTNTPSLARQASSWSISPQIGQGGQFGDDQHEVGQVPVVEVEVALEEFPRRGPVGATLALPARR